MGQDVGGHGAERRRPHPLETAKRYFIWAWSLRRIRGRMALLVQERRVEKERARIAQDLHDELGASLTEINFLGSLAADSLALFRSLAMPVL